MKLASLRVFFLLHEQYTKFTQEPGFVEVVKPFLHSGYVSDYQFFIFQGMIRQFKKNPTEYTAQALSQRISEVQKHLQGQPALILADCAESVEILLSAGVKLEGIIKENPDDCGQTIHELEAVSPEVAQKRGRPVILTGSYLHSRKIRVNLDHLQVVPFLEDVLARKSCPLTDSFYDFLDLCILNEIALFHPDLVVLTLTGPGENLRSTLLEKIKENFPQTGLYIQWWDFYDHDPEFVQLEKDCLQYADMVGIVDSYTRFRKIRGKQPPYQSYPNPARLHWHPTLFDPDLYRKQECVKKYDIAILGSAENERIKYINYLTSQYGSRFKHFGSLQDQSRFISKKDYVRFLNETKITVNTQTYRDRVQFKGKIREALSCGTFTLEEWNAETQAVIPEGVGYVFFFDHADLKEKIDYYLRNEEEREAIAQKGYEWYRENFNSQKWVRYILDHTNPCAEKRKPDGEDQRTGSPLPAELQSKKNGQKGWTGRPSKSSSPFFSIVVPTRNRSSLLVNSALPSILRQTFGDFEIVVCDNASRDDTREAVRALRDSRIRYFCSEEWIPKEDFFQFSLEHARGEFSTLFFDDDAMIRGGLEMAYLALQNGESDFLSYSRAGVYHFPNWHEDFRKNVLTIPAFSRKLLGIDARQHLKMVFEQMDILPETPMVTNAFYRTDFVKQLVQNYGRLFPHGHMGDYNTACIALWNTEEFFYLDFPLVVFGHWKENTSAQLHDLQTTMPEYQEWIAWMTENYLSKMPIRSYTWLNCVAATLLDMKKKLGLPLEFNWLCYFIDLGREIHFLRQRGIEVNAQQKEWCQAISELPEQDRTVVQNGVFRGRRVHLTNHFREIARKDGLGCYSVCSPVGREEMLFPGDSYDFHNVLEAAEAFETLALHFQTTLSRIDLPEVSRPEPPPPPQSTGNRNERFEAPIEVGDHPEEQDLPRTTDPGELFASGNYAAVALAGNTERWETYAALGLMGKTKEAVGGLDRYDHEGARFYSAVASWIGGDDEKAIKRLEKISTAHAQNLLKLIQKPKIQVLAQLPWQRRGPQQLIAGIPQDAKFQVRQYSFHPDDLPNEPYADIHRFYEHRNPPDFYICQMVEWHLIPPNLQELPCPLIGQTADYDLHIQAVYPWLQLFDEMIVCDPDEWEDVRRLVSSPVSTFPKSFGIPNEFPPYPPGPPGKGYRLIDFFMSGTIRSPYNPDKARLLNPVLRMPAIKTLMINGHIITGNSVGYANYLAHSKVTCTYTRRPANTPTRGLEALAMGCSLVVQRGNVLTLFVGEKEGVLTYSLESGDLPQAIERIVTHWADFDMRARRGAEVIRREFALSRVASQYLRFATFLAAKPRGVRRRVPVDSLDQRRMVKWKGWLPGGPEVMARIREANLKLWRGQMSTMDPRRVNLICREFFLDLGPEKIPPGRSPRERQGITQILKLYRDCAALFPQALVLHFNWIRNALHFGLPGEVRSALQAARDILQSPQRDFQVDPLDDVFTWDYNNSFFNYRKYTDLVTSYLMTGMPIQSDLFALILASLHYYVGHYSPNEKLMPFQKATFLDPDFPIYRFRYAQALMERGEAGDRAQAIDLLLDLAANSILDLEAYGVLLNLAQQGVLDKKRSIYLRTLKDRLEASIQIREPVFSDVPLQPCQVERSGDDSRNEAVFSPADSPGRSCSVIEPDEYLFKSALPQNKDLSRNPFAAMWGFFPKAEPSRAASLKGQGVTLYAKKDLRGAEKAFKEVLKINPQDPDVLVSLGRLYFDLRRYGEALEYLQEAVKVNPEDASAWAGVGLSALKLNDQKLLESAAQKVQALNPLHPLLPSLQRAFKRREEGGEPIRKGTNPPGRSHPSKAPLVSAIVSAYNAERFMRGLLEDLERQTLADRLEIVIVDSNSPQNEGAMVKEFQRRYDNIVYVRTDQRENSHVSFSRAIQLARGRYVTLANTDDRHRPDALEWLAKELEAHPEAALAYADVAITDRENEIFETARTIGYYRWPDFDPQLLFQICYLGPQPMWRREVHDRYGYFDPEFWSAGDYEFWLRLARTEKFIHIPEILGLYFISPHSNEHRDPSLSFRESEKARERYWPAEWGKRPTPFTRNPFTVSDLSPKGRGEQVAVLKRQAVHFFNQGDSSGAEKAFRLALAIDSREPDVLVSLGKIFFERKQYDQAKDYLEKAAGQSPSDKGVWIGLGLVAQHLGDLPALRTAMEKARLLDPQDPAVLSMGRWMSQKERTGGLKKSAAVPAALPEPGKINEIGEELFLRGKIEEAKEHFQKSLEMDGNFPPALNNLGVVCFQQGKIDQAVEFFQRVLEFDPKYPEAVENLGRCQEIKSNIPPEIQPF